MDLSLSSPAAAGRRPRRFLLGSVGAVAPSTSLKSASCAASRPSSPSTLAQENGVGGQGSSGRRCWVDRDVVLADVLARPVWPTSRSHPCPYWASPCRCSRSRARSCSGQRSLLGGRRPVVFGKSGQSFDGVEDASHHVAVLLGQRGARVGMSLTSTWPFSGENVVGNGSDRSRPASRAARISK